MPLRQVDSASLYQLVELFSTNPKLDRYYPWLGRVAYKTTYSLLACDFSIAPAPLGTQGSASGYYATLTRTLAKEVSLPVLDTEVLQQCSDGALEWCEENTVFFAHEFHRLAHDEKNFLPWLEWAVENAWLEHGSRLSGLFNESHIPFIARLHNVPEQEVADIHIKSQNATHLQQWVTANDSDPAKLAKLAYVTSALVRGIHHENVASKLGATHLQHPMRHELSLMRSPPTNDTNYVYNKTEELFFLSAIVIESALLERSVEGRIKKYCENVGRIRTAAVKDRVQLHFENGKALTAESAVRDAAVEIARRCNLDTTPLLARRAIDVATALLLGGLVDTVINAVGWSPVVAQISTSAESALPQDFRVSELARHVLYENRPRLARLAEAGTGRLQ